MRRGVRRRERNERLGVGVVVGIVLGRLFPSLRFFFILRLFLLFTPVLSRLRGTVLFRRFYLRGNSKGDATASCHRRCSLTSRRRRRRDATQRRPSPSPHGAEFLHPSSRSLDEPPGSRGLCLGLSSFPARRLAGFLSLVSFRLPRRAFREKTRVGSQHNARRLPRTLRNTRELL